MESARWLLSALVLAVTAHAQPPAPLPGFEVASIKENTSGETRARMQTPPGGRFVATNVLIKGLIADAFLRAGPTGQSRVIGGPAWIESARYDINAKANTAFRMGPEGPDPELLRMIRSLLEERFKLKARIETRELPVYDLVVARSDGKLGPELRRSEAACEAAMRAGGPAPPRGPLDPPPCSAMRGPARIIAGGIPMPQFAAMLTAVLGDDGRTVVDKTGLEGRYAFTLAWTPEQMPTGTPPPGVPPVDPNGPSFFTALPEQLGLKLVAAKGPVQVVVIDSIDRPSPN
jgi:uncharacterized protein (TIGR03435 family)